MADDSSEAGERIAKIIARVGICSRRDAETNAYAQLTGSKDVDELLAEPYLADPLRRHDCAPITDGAAVIVLAAVLLHAGPSNVLVVVWCALSSATGWSRGAPTAGANSTLKLRAAVAPLLATVAT